jgi:5-methylcytosine-specific restriction endonuclease McrA
VIPLMEGGLRSITNAQLLCVACHDAKSTAERKRAKSIRTSSE